MKKFKELLKAKKPSLYQDEDYSLYIEPEYRNWWTKEFIQNEFCALSQNGFLNSVFSLMVLAMLIVAITEIYIEVPDLRAVDVGYSVWYAVVVASVAAEAYRRYPAEPITWSMRVGFLMDFVSYIHYFPFPQGLHPQVICYFIRVHRPLRFIWSTDSNNMNTSLLVTALKYMYYTVLLRILCAYCWIIVNRVEESLAQDNKVPQRRMLQSAMPLPLNAPAQPHAFSASGTETRRMLYSGTPTGNTVEVERMQAEKSRELFKVIYFVNKIFIPIGISVNDETTLEVLDRVVFLLVMMIGVLMVTGAAVAALSSVISVYMRPEENFRTRYRIIMRDMTFVISVYMRPEENFRTRYRIIMRDMTSSGIPISLINKVETFYKMYWHKQRAVSATQLLPGFPPVLPKSVYTDIYFEATQKSGLLRDLSYQFLSEVARYMETILYIPGDSIIKRNSQKNSIIYITYGDIEMLTAEDDISPMLRFTRGTILTPWGACPSGGGRAHVEIRAATFCAAHVLRAQGLWRAALRHGRAGGQTRFMLAELRAHMNKVKRHYSLRKSPPARFKSSILEFKKSLMALKEARDANGELLLARPDYFLDIAGCYFMRNTFPCILQPSSSLLTAWNWLVAGVIVVVCFTYPYYLVYKKTVPLDFRFFDLMVTVVYALDIVVYLSTGANVEQGVPITFLQTSSLQARSPWFVLDVLGTVPIFTFVGDGQFAGINKILRIPKVIRVIQSLEDECVYHTNVIRFFSYALMLIIACYFLAALQQAFVCYGYGHCLVTNFTHMPFWTQAPLDDENVRDRLYFSLYWAISVLTFTSHSELGGKLEKDYMVVLYTMLLLEVCIVLHICIEAVYSATIMVTTAFRVNYDSCIADVRNFLIRQKVAPELRQRFIEHLQLCWNTRKAYSMSSTQSSVFYDLPSHVYQDILARQRSKYILCIPFMKLLHKEDLKNVSSNANIFYTAPNEILLNTGDIITEMYVIKQGFCEVLNPDTKEVVNTLVAKNHFGVLECLFRLPAFYTVRATTHVQVFSISRKYLLQALEIPQIKDAMKFAREQEEYSRLQVRREPFVSYRPPACVPNREHFRLPRKHEKDSAFRQPFKKFGFFAILRNIFPRFTFRPDSELLTRYEVCRAFCACAGAFVFPSYTYMVLQFPWLYHVALVLDLFAYSDIAFRMLVGYFDANGILIYHPANAAAHYMRGAFLMDTFSCLPLESLEVSRKYSYGKLYQVTTMKQVLMLNRLLQLYRLPGTLEVLTSRIERRDIILVLQALPLFLTMINVLTSLLVFSSVRIYHSVDELEWAFVPTEDRGGSWIYLFNKAYRFNLTETPLNLHLGCYFWVVYEATTTGYNTISPTNLNIMCVLFGAMVLGSLIMIYMSVRIISIRANVNNVLAAYQEHMKDLVQFMQREKLEKQLQNEMIDHYQFNWVKTGGVDAQNVLRLCDQIALRSDTTLHIYGPTFTKCPILADCDVSLLRVLGRAVRSIHFLEGTMIFQEDDIIDHLYFVYSGQLQVQTTNRNEEECTFTNLGIGSMVGNLDDTPTLRVASRLKAATDVHLLQMSSVDFHHIVRYCDFPVVYQLIAQYRFNDEPFINAEVTSRWRPKPKRRPTEVTRNLLFRSSIVQVFLIIISMACVYTDLYHAGFQDKRASVLTTLYVLDVCFLVKMLLYLTFPDLVTLPTEDTSDMGARQAYFKSNEFKYDVVSCLPMELLCLLSDKPRMMLSWLRLNRVLRLKTVSKYLKRYEKRATENLFLSTLALVVWFTIYVHCCTCLWFFIGLSVHGKEPYQSWFYNDDGKEICSNEYICSVFFVLTTFSQNGIADIMPRKEIEVVYVSMLSIVSTMVYVVYVGEFSNIVHYAFFRASSYYSKFLELQEFLKNNRVSPVLVALVNKYSVLLWREARGEQMPVFLVTAPLCLKLKVMSQAYKEVGEQHPVFKYCEPALIRQVVGYLRQYYYDENMYVVKQNEITNSMYLVHTGEVQEIRENDESEDSEGVNQKVYTAGEYFGVAQGFLRHKPFHYSYRTTIKSQILTLRLDDWEYLLKHFPDSKDMIDHFQWTSRGDDNDDHPGPESQESPPPYKDDYLETLGDPGGSEIGIPGEPPGSPPDLPPGGPLIADSGAPSGGSTNQTAPLIELKPSSLKTSRSSIRKISQKYNTDNAPSDVSEDTTSTEQEVKEVKLKDDATSQKAVFLKEASNETVGGITKSVVWAPKKSTRISEETGESRIEESPLLDDDSSSTRLLERIRNAAMALDKVKSQDTDDNDDISLSSLSEEDSDVVAVTIPHHSVEEYLAHKFKMRDSYSLASYTTRRDDVHRSDEARISKISLHESPTKFMHGVADRPGREDYRHSQLAETASSRRLRSEQDLVHSFSTMNLNRPLAGRAPPPAPVSVPTLTTPVSLSNDTIEPKPEQPLQPLTQENESPKIVVPPQFLQSERFDSQVPTSSKQVKLGVSPEKKRGEDTTRRTDETPGSNAAPELQLLDFDSDVAARMVISNSTDPASAITEHELRSTSENSIKILTEEQTESTSLNELRLLSDPNRPTAKQLGKLSEPGIDISQRTDDANANVDFDSDVAAHMYTTLTDSTLTSIQLPAILPAPPSAPSEPPTPPSSELPPAPTASLALPALPAPLVLPGPPISTAPPAPSALPVLHERPTSPATAVPSALSVLPEPPTPSAPPALPALPEPATPSGAPALPELLESPTPTAPPALPELLEPPTPSAPPTLPASPEPPTATAPSVLPALPELTTPPALLALPEPPTPAALPALPALPELPTPSAPPASPALPALPELPAPPAPSALPEPPPPPLPPHDMAFYTSEPEESGTSLHLLQGSGHHSVLMTPEENIASVHGADMLEDSQVPTTSTEAPQPAGETPGPSNKETPTSSDVDKSNQGESDKKKSDKGSKEQEKKD